MPAPMNSTSASHPEASGAASSTMGLDLAAAAGWATFGFLLLALLRTMWTSCDERLVYALDDAYIHLAMAKNFAAHGVWGTTTEGFAAASSSPAWVLVLAAGALFFEPLWLPLGLNVVGGVLLLGVVSRTWEQEGVPTAWRATGLAALAIALPLPTLSLSGMEHVWHALLTVVFWIEFRRLWDAPAPSVAGWAPLFASAAVLPMLRLESVFLIGVCTLALAARRRLAPAVALSTAGAVPVVLFGLWSMQHGARFLANSITAKSVASVFAVADPNPVEYVALTALYMAFCPLLASMYALAAVQSADRWSTKSVSAEGPSTRPPLSGGALGTVVFLAAATAHAIFARFDVKFVRYEAYLIAFGILVIWPGLYVWAASSTGEAGSSDAVLDRSAWRAPRWLIARSVVQAVLCLIAAAAFLERGAFSMALGVYGPKNIYEQQIQMAEFVRAYYGKASIAANDIGAISYLNPDVRLFDLVGLATQESADLLRAKQYGPEAMDRLARARKATVAICYRNWPYAYKHPPTNWTPIGTWTIGECMVGFDDTVWFFAVEPDAAPKLAAQLREFRRRLPIGVREKVAYMESHPAASAPTGGSDSGSRP